MVYYYSLSFLRFGNYSLRRVGEKFLGWVDEPLPPDTIRESVTLYWLTEILLRSIYSYREL